jgi:serine/threonine-protein kinase RsbW
MGSESTKGLLRVQLDVPSDAQSIPLCRHVVRVALQELEVEAKTASDFELVVSEATSNAVRHACKDTNSRFQLLVELSREHLRLQISDHVEGFHRAEVADPDVEQVGGRGVWLMERLADALTFYNIGDDGVCLQAGFRLR